MYRKIKKLFNIIDGHFTARRLIRKYPGCKIISTYSGVGDRVFVLAYLKNYLELFNINNFMVVSATPDNAVYQYFGVDNRHIFFLDKKRMLNLNEFYTSDWGFSFRHRHPELLSISIDAYMRLDLFDYSELFYYSDVVKSIFKLPLDSKPAKATKFEISDRIKKFFTMGKIEQGQTVVINPYANSCSEVPMSFFQIISARLASVGFHVVTSTIGEQEPLAGTIGIDFQLIEALDFCEKCGYVIGQRSGFMDLISFSEANIICVDAVSYPHSEMFKLEKCWPQNPNITTARYGSEEDNKLIDSIIEIIIGWRGARNI